MGAFALLLLAVYLLLEVTAATVVAAAIGWGWLFVAVAALGILGIAVMRRAGLAAARTLREGTSGGRLPPPPGSGAAVGDASLRFVGGALVALPGLVTSAFGLLMLIRPVRRVVGAAAVGWIITRLRARGMTVMTSYDASGRRMTRVMDGEVVEGEVVRDRPPPHPPKDPPGIESA